jgi:hypothetical protein
LTKYEYGDLYSYWIVIAIIAAILLLIALRHLRIKVKIITVVELFLIALVPTGLTLFVRGFVGDDTKEQRGYKIIYKREANPVLNGSEEVELYKTILFSLLREFRDLQYVDDNKNSCLVTLHDKKKFCNGNL